MEITQNIKNLRAVVFDWDNTLVESRTALEFCVIKVLEKYNLPEWEIIKKKRDDNLSFRDNFPLIFGDKADEAYEAYRRIYLENVRNFISLFDGVRELVDLFKNNNISMVIMSNKDRLLFDYEYKFFFKDDDFVRIVCGHEAAQDKPHSDQLFYGLKNLIKKEDINEETVWVIGDSPVDSDCAKNSGVRAIRVGFPLWDCDNENDEKISFFKDIRELYEHIKNVYGEKWA